MKDVSSVYETMWIENYQSKETFERFARMNISCCYDAGYKNTDFDGSYLSRIWRIELCL